MSASIALTLLVLAAEPVAAPTAAWDYRTYLAHVFEANPDVEAAREAVEIARAQIAVAKEFPDPQLTVGLVQLDVTRQGNPTATGVQLSAPIELGGKRSARIAVASAGVSAAGQDLEDARRALRSAAGSAFAEALRARMVLDQKQRTLAGLEKLVSVNERRLASGDIPEATLLQSRVEAEQFRAEVQDAQGELRVAHVALAQLLGAQARQSFDTLEVAGELRRPPAPIDAAALLSLVGKRPDVRAGEARVQSAELQIRSEEAKRIIDVSVNLDWQHNFPVTGDPSLNASDWLGASLSVPLPFSRLYKGELEAAKSAHRQARAQLLAVQIRAEGELRQALAQLDAAAQRVATFERGVLAGADSVLEKTLYNYQRGGATLVEVLVAERTDSDVRLAYVDALADRARAVVAVEQAAGASGLVAF